MPIDIKQFNEIKERQVKDDRDLLDFMKKDEWYTTNDVQKFLKINHTATLQRLKKLNERSYIELKIDKIYKWLKVKDMEEKEIIGGYKFYG